MVSHAFDMGEWQHDRTESVDGKSIYLWIVPAKVAGTWQLAQGELVLHQEFQLISGTLKTGDRVAPISAGRLRGNGISFRAGGGAYRGTIDGDSMEGTFTAGGTTSRWAATRSATNPPQK